MKTVRLLVIAGCCFFYSSIAAATLMDRVMDDAMEGNAYSSYSMWNKNLSNMGFTHEESEGGHRYYISEESIERLAKALLSRYMGDSEYSWEGAYCVNEIVDEGDMQTDASVPEPGALTLLSIGLLGLGMVRMRSTN